ncbi:unnamed protein product [Spirodela intermedia]|uniref:H(+)/Pi cotransporter n=1 Tax=Spirodela intermedia TaxID=51605 RepID=A0A7I8J133_SPIIN|nr:unnamed protein product [Spirodela intermedia]CAA6663111.1 unnamed protein product [Spirodela intermedia]
MCHLAPGSWEWVDGEKSSTVAEWGLICDRKFRAGIPASVFFLGSLFGSAVHGRLADKHLGRKKTVLLSCLLTAVTGFVTSLSPNVWVYALLRFSNGFARSGIGICCLVLATEAVGRKWRGQVGQYGFFFFTVGFLSLPAIAYPTRTSWRTMYRVTSLLPLAYSVVVLPFVFESPRWLAVRGRTKEAMDVLTRLAKLNGKTLSPELAIANPPVVRQVGHQADATDDADGFGIGFLYYGVQLNVENLDFNIYFTVAVNALMEIPAVFLGSVLLAFADRRLVFSSSSFAAAASCVACIFLGRTKGSWPQLTVEAIGFMAASLAFDVLYIYCVELFPTNVRNLAVSVLRQSLMLGAAIAPQLVVLGRVTPKLSFLIFACFALFSASLTIWLPETRNTPLYETMAQQEKEEKQAAGPGTETELPKRDSPLPDA